MVAATIKKGRSVDKIRKSVVERPEPSFSYPVMVRDNEEIELESVGEQKFASEAANQDLIDQPSLEMRMAAIEGHFSKFEERFVKIIEEHSAKSEVRFAKVETSLEELLGCQPEATREKPKMSLVK